MTRAAGPRGAQLSSLGCDSSLGGQGLLWEGWAGEAWEGDWGPERLEGALGGQRGNLESGVAASREMGTLRGQRGF